MPFVLTVWSCPRPGGERAVKSTAQDSWSLSLANSNQIQNELSIFWLRPCVLEEGDPGLDENDGVFHNKHFLSVICMTVYNFFLAICVSIHLHFFFFLLRVTGFGNKCILVCSLIFELV
jgi:hypothetical protein